MTAEEALAHYQALLERNGRCAGLDAELDAARAALDDARAAEEVAEELAARIRNASALKETLKAMGDAVRAGIAEHRAVKEAVDAAAALDAVVTRDVEKDK